MSSTDQPVPASGPAIAVDRRRGGPSGRERLRRSFGRWWFAYAMLVPIFVVMGLLVFYPLVKGIYLSFTNADRYNVGQPATSPRRYEWIGLDNYKEILGSQEFRDVARLHGRCGRS